VDKLNLKVGAELFHLLGRCQIHALEEFNTDPDTVYVTFKGGRIKAMPLSAMHTVPPTDFLDSNNIDDGVIVATLSGYLSRVIETDTETSVADIAVALEKVHKYIWSPVFCDEDVCVAAEGANRDLRWSCANIWRQIIMEADIEELPKELRPILRKRGLHLVILILDLFNALDH